MSSSGSRRLMDPAVSQRRRGDLTGVEPPADGQEKDEEEEAIDHFDRLPDPVLLVVLNGIGDVKALGRCSVVSRRFHSLVPLVDDVVVRVDCVISDDPSSSSSSSSSSARGGSSSGAGDKARGVFSHLARLVLGGLIRPLHALGQILSTSSSSASGSGGGSVYQRTMSSSSSSTKVSHHSPTEVLRNFKELRRLRIELPAGELGVDDGALLKWKATFGSTLDSCAILGASAVISTSSSLSPSFKSSSSNPLSLSQEVCSGEDSGSIPESFYTNGSLKLRVVWTISSLIAASARHYLLQPIIAEHETLEGLDLTDADGQGVLSMDCQQLRDLRARPLSASGCSQRTLVPALRMRLWYSSHLELPGGIILKGATLVAIRPKDERAKEVANGGNGDECWVPNAFEEPYRIAAKMLMKRKTYCLEMNSF